MSRPVSVRAQSAVVPSIVFCDVHKRQEVNLYCKNCNCLICNQCINKHGGHTFKGLMDIVEEKRKKLTKTLDKIEREIIPNVEETLQKIKRTKTEQSKKEFTLIEEVNKRADFLKSEIDKIREEFLQEVRALKASDKKNLTKCEQRLKEILDDAEELAVIYRKQITSPENAQLIKVGLNLDQDVKEIDREIKDVPKLKIGSFKAGTSNKESIKSLFGRCLEKEECEAETYDILPPQPIGHVIETKLEVVSSFQHETDKGYIRAITTLDDQSAWVATYDGKEIKRVNQARKVDKTLTFTTRIVDIAITYDGSLLVAPSMRSVGGDRYQIKKVKPNGDIVTFVDMKPLVPRCICVSRTGHLYVGCADDINFNVTDNNTRTVMKLSGTGIVQQRYQYDNNGQRLFTLPRKIQENTNDDVWVRDEISENEGRIVVLQQDGKLKFIYRGVASDKITYYFYPCDVSAVGNGKMLIADTNNDIIHVIDENGTLLYFLGSQHKTGIYKPYSVCLNRNNHMLWVGDLKGEIQILRFK